MQKTEQVIDDKQREVTKKFIDAIQEADDVTLMGLIESHGVDIWLRHDYEDVGGDSELVQITLSGNPLDFAVHYKQQEMAVLLIDFDAVNSVFEFSREGSYGWDSRYTSTLGMALDAGMPEVVKALMLVKVPPDWSMSQSFDDDRFSTSCAHHNYLRMLMGSPSQQAILTELGFFRGLVGGRLTEVVPHANGFKVTIAEHKSGFVLSVVEGVRLIYEELLKPTEPLNSSYEQQVAHLNGVCEVEPAMEEAKPPVLTAMDHIKAAFDLAKFTYTVREKDGWVYLFRGDKLEDPSWGDGLAAADIPLEVLLTANLRLYEFDEHGGLMSC